MFIWSRKRESNPPGSAWEADAIPLGDSCIWICNKQGSRKDFASAKDLWEEETQAARSSREERSGGPEGFAATREYLRTAPLRFARSVAGARPRTGSAWEADAIPLGDSCIFCCIVFVSRFHGNGSTFAQLRFRFARSVAGARPRTGSAWEADAKNRVPAKILRSKRFVGKGGAGIEAAPRRRRGRQGLPCSDAAIPARIEFLHFYYSGKGAGCQAQKMREEEKFSRILALFRRVFCMIRHNRTKRSINRLQSCGIIGIINPREEP